MKSDFIFLISIMLLVTQCGSEQPIEEQKQPVSISWEKSVPVWSKDANIYEINTRQYTKEGTFRALLPHLDRLQKMGVDILWFMPIHPIGETNRKGSLGSYYSVKDHKGINPEYGNLSDFKNLVNKAHALDMKVIIDWVPNHTAWDHPYTENKDWYLLTRDGNFQPPIGTDRSDVIQLDHTNMEMRQAIIDDMRFWLTECDIDGFRCDAAGKVPIDFWIDCRQQLDQVKDIFFLAGEDRPDMHEAFDMTCGWGVHGAIDQVVKGERTVMDLIDFLKEDNKRYKPSNYRMQFTTDHNENSRNGTIKERMGQGGDVFYVLCTTIPGMPLIYSGQETGLNKRLKIFEKDEIDWSDIVHEDFYKEMLKLKHDHSSLWNGEFGGSFTVHDVDNPNVLFYSRMGDTDEIHVVVNLSNKTQKVSAEEFSVSQWKREKMLDTSILIDNRGTTVTIEPWSYAIFSSTPK